VSGGAPNLFMLMPAGGFRYTKGAPRTYKRPDKADAGTREFCAACGTHLIARRPGLPPLVLDRDFGRSVALRRPRWRSSPPKGSPSGANQVRARAQPQDRAEPGAGGVSLAVGARR
jgi:hypothetical protein